MGAAATSHGVTATLIRSTARPGCCGRRAPRARPPGLEPRPPFLAASLGLTQREAEVLALVAEGRINRQIGQALFITEKTASLHVSHILAKLGVAGRGEAAAVAHRARPRQAMIRVGCGRVSLA